MGIDRAIGNLGTGCTVDGVDHHGSAHALAGIERERECAGIGADGVDVRSQHQCIIIGGDRRAATVAAVGNRRIDRGRFHAERERARAGKTVRRHARRRGGGRRRRRGNAAAAEAGEPARRTRPHTRDQRGQVRLRRRRRRIVIADRDRDADGNRGDVGGRGAGDHHRAGAEIAGNQRTVVAQRIVGGDGRARDRRRYISADLTDGRGQADGIRTADIGGDRAGRATDGGVILCRDRHRSRIHCGGCLRRIAGGDAVADLRDHHIINGVVGNRAIARDLSGRAAEADRDADDLRFLDSRQLHHAAGRRQRRAVDQGQMLGADPIDDN